MRERAGFGPARLTVVCAVLAAAALVPATASAVTTLYPANNARTFATDAGGWTQSALNDPGCVPGLTCPSIANSFQASGGVDGDGFIRTGLSGLVASELATSRGIWRSPEFTYGGAGGAVPDLLVFALATRSDVGGLIGVGGSVDYSVELVDVTNAAGSGTLIDPVAVNLVPGWNGVAPVVLAPNDLTLGHVYRLRITTAYETGTTLLPDAKVDYDNVGLAAEGAGAGAGGGVAGGGLAGKAAVLSGDMLRVKVRCGSAVQGKCKIKLVGLWKKAGPRVTKLRTVRVRAGKKKKVALKVKPLALAAVQTRDKIWVAIKVNANGFKTLEIKNLKLIKRG